MSYIPQPFAGFPPHRYRSHKPAPIQSNSGIRSSLPPFRTTRVPCPSLPPYRFPVCNNVPEQRFLHFHPPWQLLYTRQMPPPASPHPIQLFPDKDLRGTLHKDSLPVPLFHRVQKLSHSFFPLRCHSRIRMTVLPMQNMNPFRPLSRNILSTSPHPSHRYIR